MHKEFMQLDNVPLPLFCRCSGSRLWFSTKNNCGCGERVNMYMLDLISVVVARLIKQTTGSAASCGSQDDQPTISTRHGGNTPQRLRMGPSARRGPGIFGGGRAASSSRRRRKSRLGNAEGDRGVPAGIGSLRTPRAVGSTPTQPTYAIPNPALQLLVPFDSCVPCRRPLASASIEEGPMHGAQDCVTPL